MSKIKQLLVILAVVLGLGAVFIPANVAAESVVCPAGSTSAVCTDDNQLVDIIEIGVNTLLFAVGIAGVVVIIISGIRLILSGGDAGSVTNAKNSILYAVIGIIIAICAYAIVNFVISSLIPPID